MPDLLRPDGRPRLQDVEHALGVANAPGLARDGVAAPIQALEHEEPAGRKLAADGDERPPPVLELRHVRDGVAGRHDQIELPAEHGFASVRGDEERPA
jgi:hypothetical protein